MRGLCPSSLLPRRRQAQLPLSRLLARLALSGSISGLPVIQEFIAIDSQKPTSRYKCGRADRVTSRPRRCEDVYGERRHSGRRLSVL